MITSIINHEIESITGYLSLNLNLKDKYRKGHNKIGRIHGYNIYLCVGDIIYFEIKKTGKIYNNKNIMPLLDIALKN